MLDRDVEKAVQFPEDEHERVDRRAAGDESVPEGPPGLQVLVAVLVLLLVDVAPGSTVIL